MRAAPGGDVTMMARTATHNTVTPYDSETGSSGDSSRALSSAIDPIAAWRVWVL